MMMMMGGRDRCRHGQEEAQEGRSQQQLSEQPWGNGDGGSGVPNGHAMSMSLDGCHAHEEAEQSSGWSWIDNRRVMDGLSHGWQMAKGLRWI